MSVDYDSVVGKFKALLKSGSDKREDWKELMNMVSNLSPEEQDKYKKETWELICDIRNWPRTKEMQEYLDRVGLGEQDAATHPR